ncbi:MAG: hypothetical protein R3B48_29045 [Kofleriaceae bacterium]
MNENTTLLTSLTGFATRVNEHERVPRLIKGWNPTVVVEALDTGAIVSVVVRDSKVERVVEGAQEDSHSITVQGDEELLTQIFEGVTNPAEAVLEGGLAVFGTAQDQTKLDALTLVLWGI